jgi:hypothetical protein
VILTFLWMGHVFGLLPLAREHAPRVNSTSIPLLVRLLVAVGLSPKIKSIYGVASSTGSVIATASKKFLTILGASTCLVVGHRNSWAIPLLSFTDRPL